MSSDFQNFILDAKVAVLSMSIPRGEAIKKICSYQEILAEHLALIAAYPWAIEQRHWRKEVSAFANSVSKLSKLSKVNLSPSFVTDLLYQGYLGDSNSRKAHLEWAQHKMKRTADLDHYDNFNFRQVIHDMVVDPESILSVE